MKTLRVLGLGRIWPVVLLLVSNGQAQAPAQAPARIQVESRSVIVDVIVTGKKGEPVTTLSAGDFKLFEDNVPQKISTFEAPTTDQAPSAGAQAALTAGPARTTAPALTRSVMPHFVSLAIDMGGLQQQSYQLTAKSAIEYIQKVLAPDDYIAIYWIGSSLHSALPFTQDKAKAAETIQNLKANMNDAALSSRERGKMSLEMTQLQDRESELRNAGDMGSMAMAEMVRSQRLAMQGNMFMQSSFQARAVIAALRAIAQASIVLPGRKNVVLFSEGFVHSPEANEQANAVIDAANRANVAIYVVDPVGLNGGRQEGILRAEDSSGSGPPGLNRGRSTVPDSRNAQATDLARRGLEVNGGYNKFDAARRLDDDGVTDDLSAIASRTGGMLFKGSNDLMRSLATIDRDLREYYTLVYHPTNEDFNSSFRRIRVEVGGGYKVRARNGYWALPPGEDALMTPAAAQLLASAASGSIKSNVKSKLNAALLVTPVGDSSIAVTLWAPGELSWVTKVNKDLFTAGATVVVTARDPQGHIAAVQQRFVDLKMNNAQWQQFQNEGLVMNATLSVPKLEAHDIQAILQFANGSASIVQVKVAEQRDAKSPLVLSSLLVTPRVDAAKEADAANPLQVENYQLVLPADPQFPKTGKLTVYMEMLNYPHTAAGGLQLDMAFAIKSNGKVVRDLAPTDLHPLANLPNGAFLLTQYDLTGLAPGSYTLEAKMHDLVRNSDTIQSAPFSIQ